jgi:hypothetical protein
MVVTFFTLLPSFLFIMLDGPFVETPHGSPKFAAPLTCMTDAIAGVIANLAAFFRPARAIITSDKRRVRLAFVTRRTVSWCRTVPLRKTRAAESP